MTDGRGEPRAQSEDGGVDPLPALSSAWLVAANLGLACAYAAVGAFGLIAFAEPAPDLTLIWLSGGLALAAMLLWGPRLLPGVLVGALAAGSVCGGPGAAAVSAAANLAEVVIAWWVLRRAGFSVRLGEPRDLLLLIAGGSAGSFVSAAISAAAMWASSGGPLSPTVLGYLWLGHAAGIVVVAPLALMCARGTPRWGELARRPDAWAVAGAIATAGAAAFLGQGLALPARLMAVFLPYLALVWAGARLGPRGAAGAAVLTSTLALIGRARGTGPLGDQAHVLPILTYVVTVAVTAVVLATTTAQREASARAQRRAARRVDNLEEQIRHAQRLEGFAQLAGGVAHDFNNLLFVIRANTGMLSPQPDQADLVGEIEAATQRAAGLCRQLLDYAGRGTTSLGPVDLAEVVREARAALHGVIPAGVSVHTDLGAAIPAHGDALQVRRALESLIQNAAEAIGDAGGTVRVATGEVTCAADYLRETFLHSDAPPGRFVFVDVEDDGVGMDPGTLQRMFDPFFTTKASARGLGLISVAGVARTHGGAIKVTSQVGKGSAFRLLLRPWQGVPADPEPTPPPQRRVGATVLVADDEPAVLRATKRLLQRHGYEVLTAADGAEAVEVYLANAARVDAVLLDVSMPRLTGPRAAQRMRETQGRAIPVVLMSGNLPDATLPDLAGLTVIAKPFGAETLLEAVDGAIHGRRRSS